MLIFNPVMFTSCATGFIVTLDGREVGRIVVPFGQILTVKIL